MLQTNAQQFPLVNSEIQPFEFAGFIWPRYVATLPTGALTARLAKRKESICGPYYHAPKPAGRGHGRGFYLESQGAPGLRWRWCDDVTSSIRHNGWFTDDDGTGETIRGLVLTLPSGRGYLAGWSMGENMASELDCQVYDEECDAAHAADRMAERAAEAEREYQREWRRRAEDEDLAEVEC